MDVFDSPLNKAHYFSRKADSFAKKKLFDEACKSHEQAAFHLLQALKITENCVALESIELQRRYHLKKEELLRLRKFHQETVRVQKEAMSRALKVSKSSVGGDGNGSLQKAIYRTFDEADSLLEILGNRKDLESPSAVFASGSKRPKDDSVVIEELRIVNYQLRSLIRQLMEELTTSEQQVARLKARVTELETSTPEAKKYSTICSDEDKVSHNEAAQSEGAPLEDLPALAPLELPEFSVGKLTT